MNGKSFKKNIQYKEIDATNYKSVLNIFKKFKPDAVSAPGLYWITTMQILLSQSKYLLCY